MTSILSAHKQVSFFKPLIMLILMLFVIETLIFSFLFLTRSAQSQKYKASSNGDDIYSETNTVISSGPVMRIRVKSNTQ